MPIQRAPSPDCCISAKPVLFTLYRWPQEDPPSRRRWVFALRLSASRQWWSERLSMELLLFGQVPKEVAEIGWFGAFASPGSS
jgi:hypothetical protein